MKRILYLLVCLLLFSSCTNQKEDQNKAQDDTALPVTAKEDTAKEILDETGESQASSVPENDKEPINDPSPIALASLKAAKEHNREVFQPFEMIHVRDNNAIHDTGLRTHVVYLPPSYYESDQAYPVIYYFHGFNGTPLDIRALRLQADARMSQGTLEECIIVGVNYGNRLGGTFLANSPLIGNWEDGFIKELLPFIDATYRTIPTREGRGLTGFSMGGYASLSLAIKYPDLFGADYSMGPGLLIQEDLSLAMGSWSDQFRIAYGSAFSPTGSEDPTHEIPLLNNTAEDDLVIARWMSGFGNLDEKALALSENHEFPLALGLEVAENDMFPWITTGTNYLSEQLNTLGLSHSLIINQKGHTLDQEMFCDHALPFLLDTLGTTN